MHKRKAIKTYPAVFTYGIWVYKVMDFKKRLILWVAKPDKITDQRGSEFLHPAL